MPNHIFVSYAHQDKQIAMEVAHKLMSDGLNIWIDQFIPTGNEWEKNIENALNDAVHAIVVWSEHAARSEYVAKEIARCAARGIKISTYRFDKTQLSAILQSFQYNTDMRGLIRDVKLKPEIQSVRRIYKTYDYDGQKTLAKQISAAKAFPESNLIGVPLIESSRAARSFLIGEPDKMYGRPNVMQLFVQAQKSRGAALPKAVFDTLFVKGKRSDALFGIWVTGPLDGFPNLPETASPFDRGANFTVPVQFPDIWYDIIDTVEKSVDQFGDARFEVFLLTPSVIAMVITSRLRKFWNADLYHYENEAYNHVLSIIPE